MYDLARGALLAVLLGVLAGCGGTTGQAAGGNQDALVELGEMYKSLKQEGRKPPAGQSNLEEVEPMLPLSGPLIRDGIKDCGKLLIADQGCTPLVLFAHCAVKNACPQRTGRNQLGNAAQPCRQALFRFQRRTAFLAELQVREKHLALTGRKIAIQVTLQDGAMLMGTEISAALTTLEPFDLEFLGLNCSTGPELMNDAIRYLGDNSPHLISCQPNAGSYSPIEGSSSPSSSAGSTSRAVAFASMGALLI